MERPQLRSALFTKHLPLVFGFVSPRRQELLEATERWPTRGPVWAPHQPTRAPAAKSCVHGVPVPSHGRPRGGAAGGSGSQPGEQTPLGHPGGPGQRVETRPHYPAQLRHGVSGEPGKKRGARCKGITVIPISVFQRALPIHH